MKIIDRKTFLEMPPGIIYAKYEPCNFGGLNIKWESMIHANDYSGDFVCQGLGVEVKCDDSDEFESQCSKAEKGEEIDLDFECAGRDGLFEKDQLFAILSKKDVELLINRLQETL